MSKQVLSAGVAVLRNPFAGLTLKFGSKNIKKENYLSPTNKLFRSYIIAIGVVFLIGMISPSYAKNTFYDSSEGGNGGAVYYNNNVAMLADQEGYITKINPQTQSSDRAKINGTLIHQVELGDTVSTIANSYGLKTNTVLWANGLSANSTLKIGRNLVIPAVNGVSHTVTKGQTIKKIASLYGVNEEKIIQLNKLNNDGSVKAGQTIFIPDGKPLPGIINHIKPSSGIAARINPSRIASTTRLRARGAVIYSTAVVPGIKVGANSSSIPAVGKIMIKPTHGIITQGFHRGHYAYDIGNRSRPPIWAAMDGTVVKVSTGTWGGGYGNHVVIDHGHGLQTLYAHMKYVSVKVGEHVKQGQVIGKMGRTGNVRGPTGIHLHFEVHKNGVKVNPGNYF